MFEAPVLRNLLDTERGDVHLLRNQAHTLLNDPILMGGPDEM